LLDQLAIAHDEAMSKVMLCLQLEMNRPPFDDKRPIYDGFEMIVDA
jgi:uncharacterized protein YbaA (DUF1428 family)